MKLIDESAPKPRVRVKAGRPPLVIIERPYRVVWFTDAHNSPKQDTARFKWLAQYINEKNPDAVIDTGDFDDLESLCGHVGNETHDGRFKPSFQADLEASALAHQTIKDNLRVSPTLFRTLGNHEDRLFAFENRNPEIFGMMQHAYLSMIEGFGWTITKYKDYLDIAGVDFTHVPMTVMNKPAGGRQLANTVAKGSMRDVCFGHTHKYSRHNDCKFGPSRSVTAIEGGCFMPEGYMPSYAKGSMKEFWYGVHYLTILGGKILDHETVSMHQLRRRYG